MCVLFTVASVSARSMDALLTVCDTPGDAKDDSDCDDSTPLEAGLLGLAGLEVELRGLRITAVAGFMGALGVFGGKAGSSSSLYGVHIESNAPVPLSCSTCPALYKTELSTGPLLGGEVVD